MIAKQAKAALCYARKGIPVFPCEPGGKDPLTKHGFKDATTNQSRITAWWIRWPNANIGAPTGARSGFWVLDIDADKGGVESLAALIDAHGELPQTASVRTGRGGRHYYFRYPDDGTVIPNSAGKLGHGLDVRGEGGYVLVPPSVTEGRYEQL
jgi:hypothetical protein